MTKGAYKISINEPMRTIHMWINGTFSDEEYRNFSKDYTSLTSGIDLSLYTLEVDCRMMGVLPPYETEKLYISFVGYKNDGIPNINVIITSDQVVSKLQFIRLANKAGLDNIEFILKGLNE